MRVGEENVTRDGVNNLVQYNDRTLVGVCVVDVNQPIIVAEECERRIPDEAPVNNGEATNQK